MADEVLEVGRRLRRREFLIAGAGAGLALGGPINYAALARARSAPAGDARQVRLRRRLRLPVPEGDHAVDARLGAAPLLEAHARGRRPTSTSATS